MSSNDPTALLREPVRLDPPTAPPSRHVLVLDDQKAIRLLLGDVLEAHHYQPCLCASLEEARARLVETSFDALIVDIFLADGEYGLNLLADLKALQPNTPAIVISGMAGMDQVMEALKAGAYDMLIKPFNMVDVINVVARAVEKKQMADENRRLMAELRRERDLLEERVQAATHDLQDKVETLRLMNQQLATMFEMSQMTSGDGSAEGMLRGVFELLRRVIDFEGAFCVVYDLVVQDVSLSFAEGGAAPDFRRPMTALLKAHAAQLLELAGQPEPLAREPVKAALRRLYPAPWPEADVMLMPLHVPGTLLGVAGLIRRGAPRHLSDSEERLLAIAIAHFLAALEQRSYIARTGQLAGLGELISEIAHDLRHPMTALRGASRILMDGWHEEARRTRCLDEIQGNLGRMESLVSELVNFYNPRDMNMIPVDIHTLLDKALSVSHFLLEQKQIVVERHYEGSPLPILGLTRNLVEAFVNLISNACQAMSDGGRLRLATRAALEPAHRQRLQTAGRLGARYIMVTIEDNGCGIPEENRDRVFRRFFTTRPEGHGLGLSAVQRIIKKNLGVIDFESAVGQGTTFYLYLPKA